MSELEGAVTKLNGQVKNVKNGTARLLEICDAVADEAKDHSPDISRRQFKES